MPIARSFCTECWVGLVFSSPADGDEGHQREVDEAALLRPQLAAPIWRIASRNGRDSMSPTVPPISTSTTSTSLGAALDEFLDLVGDVRDHLHRLAEIVAAALLGEHRLVDPAGGEVVAASPARR